LSERGFPDTTKSPRRETLNTACAAIIFIAGPLAAFARRTGDFPGEASS